jgi:hypothetical protein
MSVPLDGGATTTLASAQATPLVIGVQAGSVYWATAGTDSSSGTMKLTLK